MQNQCNAFHLLEASDGGFTQNSSNRTLFNGSLSKHQILWGTEKAQKQVGGSESVWFFGGVGFFSFQIFFFKKKNNIGDIWLPSSEHG